jgi:hypothetical protein
MKKSKKIFMAVLLISILTVALAACSGNIPKLKKLEGDGNIQSVSLDLEADKFYEIEISIDVSDTGMDITDVLLNIGEEYAPFEVVTDKNILDTFEISVKDDKITVKGNGLYRYKASNKIIINTNAKFKVIDSATKLIIDVESVRGDMKIKTSGILSGEISDIKCENFEMIDSGVVNLTLNGEVENLRLKQSGATTLSAYGLAAQKVSINASGVTNSEINAVSSLNVRASGIYSIYYKGDPVTDIKKSGIGSITKK